MTPAIDVEEVAVPEIAKRPGSRNHRAFQITSINCTIGVLYAEEPHMPGCKFGVHYSISKTARGCPKKVLSTDRHLVEDVLNKQGLATPDRFDLSRFMAGPFADKGVHVWQK